MFTLPPRPPEIPLPLILSTIKRGLSVFCLRITSSKLSTLLPEFSFQKAKLMISSWFPTFPWVPIALGIMTKSAGPSLWSKASGIQKHRCLAARLPSHLLPLLVLQPHLFTSSCLYTLSSRPPETFVHVLPHAGNLSPLLPYLLINPYTSIRCHSKHHFFRKAYLDPLVYFR